MMSLARLPPRLDRIQRATSGGRSLVTCPDIDGLKATLAGGANANARDLAHSVRPRPP